MSSQKPEVRSQNSEFKRKKLERSLLTRVPNAGGESLRWRGQIRSGSSVFCLLTSAFLLLALTSCSKHEEQEIEAPAPVQVTAVTQDTIRRIVAGDGVLYPLDQQNVMPKPNPSGASSPIQKFYVNRGDHVKAGQLLAVLENRDLKFTAESNKAQVDQAEANLQATEGATIPESVVKARTDVEADHETAEAAKKVLESRQELFKAGAIARRQVDEAQVNWAQANSALLTAQEHLRALQAVARDAQIKQAAAQVAAAREQYRSAQAQVEYTEIRSPMNGTIADRPLYAGDMASTGQPLFSIVDVSRVVARVNVPQAQASQVRLGQPAVVTITDGAEDLQGKVTVVSPATDPSSTTVQVWVEIENPGERLKPGTAVHAAVVTEIFKAVPVVPAAAILPGEEGGTAVLVVDSNSVAHLRPVQVGVREGNKVQVLNGARPGDEVVTVGGLGVDDKSKVKVIDTTVKEAEDEDEDENAPPEPPAKGGKDQKQEEAKPKGQ
jgi:HlyD family secretion protein